MTTPVDHGILVKVFVGALVTSEVRMHLNCSDLWKQDQVIRSEEGQALEKVRHQEKEYVGLSIDEKTLTLDSLQELQQFIRKALSRYSPELNVETLKVYVFPQLFLS